MLKQITDWWHDNIKPVYADDLIEFYCDPALFDVIPHPVPAFKIMPDWYKNMGNYVADAGRDMMGGHGMTAKKCMPIRDALSTGYHILMPCDVNVTVDERGMTIFASKNPLLGEMIQFHGVEQAGGADISPAGKLRIPKFVNPWIIKTRKGYSVRVDPPPGRFNEPFTALPGIIDTDAGRYQKQINFPAVWHRHDFDGIIKAGTPIVTVTPFRRNDLPRYPTVRRMTPREADYAEKIHKQQISRNGVYTDELREPRTPGEQRKQEEMIAPGCPFHAGRKAK